MTFACIACGTFSQKQTPHYSSAIFLHKYTNWTIFERHAHYPNIGTIIEKTPKSGGAVNKDITNGAATAFFKINTTTGGARYNARRNTEIAV